MKGIRTATMNQSIHRFCRRLCTRRLSALLSVLLFPLIARASETASDQNAKNILILLSFSPPYENSLKSALRKDTLWPLNFNIEYLDVERFQDQRYEDGLVATLRHLYSGKRFDLVIPAAYPALELVLRHRAELFPDVPIVFSDVDESRLDGQQMWPGVTGVTDSFPIRGTVELAFSLHPDLNTVAIIANHSEFEDYWRARLHAEISSTHKSVTVVDLVSLPAKQVFDRISSLPPQSIAFSLLNPLPTSEPVIGDDDMLARVGQHVPTYCIFPDICLGHGGIAGVVLNYTKVNSMTAELARKVLSGEKPDAIPRENVNELKVQADWRQLRHWHIPESALPPGSLVLYREPTFLERDRKYIIPGIAVIVAQLLLILGLLWQRARKRKAEAVLRESERRFRVMADATPSLVWMCDSHGRITYLNERRVAFTGPDPNAGYGDTWATYVHPDDLAGTLEKISQALETHEPFSKEYRLRRSDGVYRWMFDVASPRVDGNEAFIGFIGSAIDVTDQKLAQQALEQVSGQLIEAQEKERTRIARDLHDDICQRLALLSMELEQADRGRAGSRPGAKDSLENIRTHCAEIATDVQSLSHQLHSSRLDLLGIVAAIRGFCREFSKKHTVHVEFTDKDVPRKLPHDVSLCLFRITQEALHNAVKYSGTTDFKVDLYRVANEIRLVVTDQGIGFDMGEAREKGGLGLLSMQERIHLVRGKLEIESAPGMGTKVVASVPGTVESQGSIEEGVVQDSRV